MRSRRLLALLAVSAIPSVAHAQDVPVQGPPTPPGRFDSIVRGVTTSAEVSSDDAKASADIAGVIVHRTDDGGGNQGQSAFLWKLGVEVPVGGETDLLASDLDVFDDQPSLSAGLTYKSFSSSLEGLDHPRFRQHIPAAIEACKKRNATKKEGETKDDCDALAQLPASVVIQDYLPAVYRRLAGTLYDSFFTIGLSGTVGIKDFDFVEVGTLAKQEERRTSYGAKLTGVYYPSDTVSAWKLEAEYAHAYDAADDAIVCKTTVTNPADDCVQAAPTGPSVDDTLVARFEYRRFFPFAGSSRGLGFAPMVSADMLSGDRGAELPVFLSLGSDALVSPGFKVGYSRDGSKPDDENEEIILSFFLKTSFGY